MRFQLLFSVKGLRVLCVNNIREDIYAVDMSICFIHIPPLNRYKTMDGNNMGIISPPLHLQFIQID